MVYKPSYIFWSKIFSILVGPYFKFFNFFRKKYDIQSINVKTILVTEYHRIGDVIIIAPILRSIKLKFPNSKIILLCNESAKELAEYLKLADKIIGISVPWTNWSWSFLEWYKIRSFAKSLRLLGVDLGVDFKGDIRNSWFLWNIHPKISFGYDTTGGGYFYTKSFFMDQNIHQNRRALKLIEEFGCQSSCDKKHRYHSIKDGCVVLHPGSSDLERSWPDSHWVELARLLSIKFKVSIVITKDSSSLVSKLKLEDLGLKYFEGSLVSFCDYIKNQKCLIALDSMAGHLASYFGIPVISLFGSQNPSLTKPKNKYGKIIKPKTICKHDRDHWRLCKLCIESISPRIVYEKTIEHIVYIESIL